MLKRAWSETMELIKYCNYGECWTEVCLGEGGEVSNVWNIKDIKRRKDLYNV